MQFHIHIFLHARIKYKNLSAKKIKFFIKLFLFSIVSDQSDFFGFIVVNLRSIYLRIVAIYVSKLTF